MGIGTLGPGGSEKQLARLARELVQESGLDVRVLVCDLQGKDRDFHAADLKNLGIPLLTYERPRGASRVSLLDRAIGLDFLSQVKALEEQIQEIQPTVVHCWLDQVNIELGLAAVLAGTDQVVLSLRSLPPFHFRFFHWYMKPVYQRLSKCKNVSFVSNSSVAARQYEQWLGLDPGSISTIPNAITGPSSPRALETTTPVAPRTLTERKHYRVGGLMRLSKEKDPLLWIDVACELHERGLPCEFILGGDGPLRESLERMIWTRGLSGIVSVKGLIADSEQFLRDLDILLSTSLIEGLPNVIIEAQSVGVYVVATDVGGTGEAMAEGETGTIIGSRRAADIADAVQVALQSESILSEARQRGPHFVWSKFGLKSILAQWLAVYSPPGHT